MVGTIALRQPPIEDDLKVLEVKYQEDIQVKWSISATSNWILLKFKLKLFIYYILLLYIKLFGYLDNMLNPTSPPFPLPMHKELH